jgi:serine/threonine protein kinase
VVGFLNGIDRDKNTRVVRGVSYLVHHTGRRFPRQGPEIQAFFGSLDGLEAPALALEPSLGIPVGDPHGTQTPMLGGFPLLRELGRGPAGVVFKSKHPDLRTDVAVKVFSSVKEPGPKRALGILGVMKAATGAGGPHLVRIDHVGSERGIPFLVMEWVRGGSLADLLRAVQAGQPLPESAIIELGMAAADGLEAVHASGMIHGNLKPENILLPADWEQAPVQLQNAKLTDFGLACLTAPADAPAEPGARSPSPYRAPELCSGASQADERSDIYSLGAVLFHMATGAPPDGGHPEDDERLLSSGRPDLSRGVTDVILQLLAPDPSGRFRHARAVRAALNCVLEAASRTTANPPRPLPESSLDKALRISEHGLNMIAQLKNRKQAT